MSKKNGTHKNSNHSKSRDRLAPYREQSQPIIRLLFGDNTPDFIRDLTYEWLSQLENETQVFYNVREIAEVSIPLMLQRADEMGIDAGCSHSDFVEAVAAAWHNNIAISRQHVEETSFPVDEGEALRREVEWDAAAIARILNSPHVPPHLKANFSEQVLEYTNELNEAPEVIKVQYPLAVMKYNQEPTAQG